MKDNFYKILSVSDSASQQEIEKAYRKLVVQNHPDKFQDESQKKQAEEKLQKFNQAYEILSDPKKRREYDNFIRFGGGQNSNFSNFQDGGGSSFFGDFGFGGFDDIGNIFKQFFDFDSETFHGSMGHGAHRKSIKLEIPLNEWYTGGKQNIKYQRIVVCQKCTKSTSQCFKCKGQGRISTVLRRNIKCDICNGTGQQETRKQCSYCKDGTYQKEENITVQMPAFAESKLRLVGYGDYYKTGYGDLEINLSVKSDPRYTIEEEHIFLNISIGIEEFIYGTKIQFKFLDERIININIPPLTTKTIVENGKGIIKNGARGNLYINRTVIRNANLPNKDKFSKEFNIEKIENNTFKRIS